MSTDTAHEADASRLHFAHLTDPHLTSLAGVAPSSLRDKRILGWLSWRLRRRHVYRPEVLEQVVADIGEARVDHTVVTGDLTHVGHPSEITAARDWLRGLGDTHGVSLVPGNHDQYIEASRADFLATWHPWLCGDDGKSDFPFCRIRGPVAFIGVDTAWASPPAFATGHVGSDQRARMVDCLRRTGASGLVRVVLIHHSPAPGADSPRKHLVDAQQVSQALAEVGAELVLHGHGHRFRQQFIDGPSGRIPVIQGPAASATSTDPTRRGGWISCRVERDGARARLAVELRTPGVQSAIESLHFETPLSR